MISYELLLKALEECFKVIRARGLKLKGFSVMTTRDYELDWEAIKIKFVLEGEHKDLLKIWDELSKKVSQIFTVKHVYVEVEPDGEEG